MPGFPHVRLPYANQYLQIKHNPAHGRIDRRAYGVYITCRVFFPSKAKTPQCSLF